MALTIFHTHTRLCLFYQTFFSTALQNVFAAGMTDLPKKGGIHILLKMIDNSDIIAGNSTLSDSLSTINLNKTSCVQAYDRMPLTFHTFISETLLAISRRRCAGGLPAWAQPPPAPGTCQEAVCRGTAGVGSAATCPGHLSGGSVPGDCRRGLSRHLPRAPVRRQCAGGLPAWAQPPPALGTCQEAVCRGTAGVVSAATCPGHLSGGSVPGNCRRGLSRHLPRAPVRRQCAGGLPAWAQPPPAPGTCQEAVCRGTAGVGSAATCPGHLSGGSVPGDCRRGLSRHLPRAPVRRQCAGGLCGLSRHLPWAPVSRTAGVVLAATCPRPLSVGIVPGDCVVSAATCPGHLSVGIVPGDCVVSAATCPGHLSVGIVPGDCVVLAATCPGHLSAGLPVWF